MDTVLDNDRIRRNLTETKASWAKAKYYEEAEKSIGTQWNGLIWPTIKDCDFSCVLDLAAGHGRNTAKLIPLSREIFVVDINEPCIAACKERFKDYAGPCRLHYFVNDGRSLPMLSDGSISLVYSWDAMVHFDKLVIERYVHEFARVLRAGGRGFIHHSNYGALAPDPESNWLKNPAWRSTMTKDLMAQYCGDAGLKIISQRVITWGGIPELDCVSLFRKPG